MFNRPIKQWTHPTQFPLLQNNDVHIWRIVLPESIEHHQRMTTVLTNDERQRFASVRNVTMQATMVTTRSVLRTLLSRYLAVMRGQEMTAVMVPLTTNRYGKPILMPNDGQQEVMFNVTHTQHMALIAVTATGNVGIDCEYLPKLEQYEQVARRFFSHNEQRMLRDLPLHQRQLAFMKGWTRKEAYLKARGMGMSLDMQQFDVSLHPQVTTQTVHSREQGQAQDTWMVADISVGSEYCAAVAVNGGGRTLRCWEWVDDVLVSQKRCSVPSHSTYNK